MLPGVPVPVPGQRGGGGRATHVLSVDILGVSGVGEGGMARGSGRDWELMKIQNKIDRRASSQSSRSGVIWRGFVLCWSSGLAGVGW